MTDDREALSRITADLLAIEEHGRRRQAALDLHALFCRLSGFRDDSLEPEDSDPTILPSGRAIGPQSAGRCVLDYARTSKFLLGVEAALRALRESFPERPVEVLYAGTGPFATLAVPMMDRFTAEEVRFTLLDIHTRSLDCARRLIEALGFAGHVRDFVRADAAVHEVPKDSAPDLLITETMQRALIKEPQAAVTLNLAPQLRPGGILIPERIAVDACLYNPGTEMQMEPAEADAAELWPVERMRLTLGRLMDLSLENVPRLREEGFPAVRIEVPADAGDKLRLALRTRLTVFGPIAFDDYESGLTCLHHAREFDVMKPGSRAEFRYVSGSAPGFQMSAL